MRAREVCCGAEGARLSIEVLTLTEPRRTTVVLPRTSDADEKQPSFALKYCAHGHLSPNAAARAVVGSIDDPLRVLPEAVLGLCKGSVAPIRMQ
jgi:hypothetical protein